MHCVTGTETELPLAPKDGVPELGTGNPIRRNHRCGFLPKRSAFREVSALDLARWQFAITTIYHFLFVPITIGLVWFVAIFQTLWHRTATSAGCGSPAFSGS